MDEEERTIQIIMKTTKESALLRVKLVAIEKGAEEAMKYVEQQLVECEELSAV